MCVMEYYSALKREETLPHATWMDLEGTVLSEASQSQRDKYQMIPLNEESKTVKLVERGEGWLPGARATGKRGVAVQQTHSVSSTSRVQALGLRCPTWCL